MALPDLIDQAPLLAALPDLPAAQQALLPALAAAASRAIRRWCARDFTRTTYDRVVTPALDGTVVLDQFPVNAVLRVAAGREAAVTIGNADPATNQRATVGYATAGDADGGLTVTGLTLTRVASGVASTATIAFAALTPPTVAALAVAVNALGGGWQAAVQGPYGPWGVAELAAADAPAQGAFPGADLLVWARDLAGCRFDAETGVLWTGRARLAGVDGPAWGPDWQEAADPRPGRVRVVYDAGFDAVPADVQQACIEVVADLLNVLQTDQRLSSETDGAYSWVRDSAFADYALTKSVLGTLAPYRNHRA